MARIAWTGKDGQLRAKVNKVSGQMDQSTLSKAELDILSLIAEGFTDKEIAAALGKSFVCLALLLVTRK